MTAELTAGQPIGPYRLLFRLGKGGMGEVWAAQRGGRHGFEKLVALKVLLDAEAGSNTEVMFLDEARATATLAHPAAARRLTEDEVPPLARPEVCCGECDVGGGVFRQAGVEDLVEHVGAEYLLDAPVRMRPPGLGRYYRKRHVLADDDFRVEIQSHELRGQIDCLALRFGERAQRLDVDDIPGADRTDRSGRQVLGEGLSGFLVAIQPVSGLWLADFRMQRFEFPDGALELCGAGLIGR